MAKGGKRSRPGKGGIELAEEAFHLIRCAPVSVWATYAIGSVPFVLGLLFFCADMRMNAFSDDYCFEASFVLALLFVWMKTFESIYARGLMAVMQGTSEGPWTARRVARAAAMQAAVQPLGLLAVPVSMLMGIPFGWVYAFFQNVTVFAAESSKESFSDVVRRSWKLGLLHPFQNHMVLWVLSPWMLGLGLAIVFGAAAFATRSWGLASEVPQLMWLMMSWLVVILFNVAVIMSPLGAMIAANITILLVIAPMLLKSWFGIETIFSLSGPGSIFNTTFLIVVVGLSYLCMQPVLVAAYVLRCFYGEAIRSGADIRAELVALRRGGTGTLTGMMLFATILIAAPGTCGAAQQYVMSERPAVASVELDQSIEEVLTRAEYRWRLPEENQDQNDDSMFMVFLRKCFEVLKNAAGAIERLMSRIEKWFMSTFEPKEKARRKTSSESDWRFVNWQDWQRALALVLLTVLCCVVGIVGYRLWRKHRKDVGMVEAVPSRIMPDLENEDITADELPADEWTTHALELLRAGELRLALRALHMGCLAFLADHERVTIARYKSNGDYRRELCRKARNEAALLRAFQENVSALESVWYGRHEATPEILRAVIENRTVIVGGQISELEAVAGLL